MKLLLDQNISFRVLQEIKDKFPEAKHVKDFDLAAASDSQIWQFAKENQCIIVTFDADFFDLLTLYSYPPKIIWLRTGNTGTKSIVALLLAHFQDIRDFISDTNRKEGCLEIVRRVQP